MDYKLLLLQSTDIDKTLNLLHHQVLENISKKKKIIEFFYLFLDSNSSENLLKFHDNPKALLIILDILKNSSQLLCMGNDLNRNGSFTSISQKTASITQDLHFYLLENISRGNCILYNLEILEILSKTSYETLSKGPEIRLETLNMTLNVLYSTKDSKIQIQALKVIIELLNSKLQQGLDLGLLSEIFERFLNETEEVRVSVFMVLCGFFKNFENLESVWILSQDRIDQGCRDKSDKIREAALQSLLQYATRLKISKEQTNMQLDWWITVMRWVLPLVNDPADFVRVAALEVLSQISSEVLEQLPSKLVFTVQSIGIGMLMDDIPNVRAAACGFLGVLVSFDSVQKDLLFFSDLITKIPNIIMQDESLVVKVRGSWALANICAAFMEINSVGKGEFSIPDKHLRKCVEAALFASKDKEKCRPNGVRALGNIFNVLPGEWIQAETEGLLKEIIEVLIKNINTGPVKTRWNACHAMANILKSYHFPVRRASFTDLLLKTLQEAMISSKNFKVRIAATTALAAVKPTWFGNDVKQQEICINSMLENLELALTKTDDLVGSDFGEFKYQKQLREQIITTQAHFAQLQLKHA